MIKNKKVIIIENCLDCSFSKIVLKPLYSLHTLVCDNPAYNKRKISSLIDYSGKIPDWCPLESLQDIIDKMQSSK